MQAITTSRPLLYPSPQANKRQGLRSKETQYEARFANGPPPKTRDAGRGQEEKGKRRKYPWQARHDTNVNIASHAAASGAQQEAVAQRGFQKLDN